jgi:broad specificity phosphatase PhoE
MKALHFIFSGPALRLKLPDPAGSPGMFCAMAERAECIAKQLIAGLKPGRFLRVFSGPDPFSRDMAGTLADFSMQTLKTIPAFKAMDLGEWSGLSIETILSQDSSRFRSWQQDPNFPSPGGEAIADFARRIWTEFVFEVEQSSPEEDLVFYVSDFLIAVVVCQILEAPLSSAHLLTMQPFSRTTFLKVNENFFQLETFNRTWDAGVKTDVSEDGVLASGLVDQEEEPLPVPV